MNNDTHDMTVFEAMKAVMKMHGNASPFVIRVTGDKLDAIFSGRGEDFTNGLVEISRTNPAVKEILETKTYHIRNPWGIYYPMLDGWCEIRVNRKSTETLAVH